MLADYEMNKKTVELEVEFLNDDGSIAPVEGVPVWTSSDESLATVEASEDGMSAVVTRVGPEGDVVITVTGDPNLDPEVTDEAIGEFHILIVAGGKVTAVIKLKIAAAEPLPEDDGNEGDFTSEEEAIQNDSDEATSGPDVMDMDVPLEELKGPIPGSVKSNRPADRAKSSQVPARPYGGKSASIRDAISNRSQPQGKDRAKGQTLSQWSKGDQPIKVGSPKSSPKSGAKPSIRRVK